MCEWMGCRRSKIKQVTRSNQEKNPPKYTELIEPLSFTTVHIGPSGIQQSTKYTY
jgi:hypothetical protein